MLASSTSEKDGAYIFDASTFLKGLRSISLRNLSIRRSGASVGTSGGIGGIGGGRATGERDSASAASVNLQRLRAVIVMNHAGDAGAGLTGAVGGLPNKEQPPPATTGGGDGLAAMGTAARGETVVLTTGLSQPTVNPTWPISETSWLQADAKADDLDSTRLLLLRVFAGDHSCSQPAAREAFQAGPIKASGGRRPTASAETSYGDNKSSNNQARGEGLSLGPAGSAVWESVIDVRGLTALPAGARLSHFWALPADCLLVEMSNGGLYAPDWVVQALSRSSALPSSVEGGRARAGGGGAGGGGDAWRDDSDEEDDEDQEPLDQVLERVLALEKEAEKGRAELAALLEKAAPGHKRACSAAENACTMETLRLELAKQEQILEMEEAAFSREKRELQAETVAVEELLKGLAEVEEAAAEDGRLLEMEKRETLKSHVLLEARRARLTAELQAIYPIKYQEKLKEFTIRGLELPADLYTMDDERVSSALGYTAHLVCMLAKYLQIPLRYQVIYNASRSAVRDNVTGAGVAYPLFRRGVEKERFDRGVYLLGRDVEQMLVARGLPAKRGVGHVLRNLERLMSMEGA